MKLWSKILLCFMLLMANIIPPSSDVLAAFTPNKLYNNQTTGSNTNTWGITLNQNFTAIDNNLGGTLTLGVGGAGNVTLTSSQAQNLIYDLTGVLTGNIIVYFPAQGGFYYINNETTGAFTLTVEGVGASSGVVIPQGQMLPVVVDNSTSPPTIVSLTLAFAQAGANSNITSISGLTTPLSAPQGGSAIYYGGTTGGTANAQTISATVPSNCALSAGNIVTGVAGFTNTGAATLTVNATATTAVRKETPSGLAALTGNEMVAGQPYVWYYDGTYLDLIGAGNNPFTTEGTIASASTTDLGSITTSNVISITGGTTINSFGSSANTNNPLYFIRFTSVLTLTNNGTSLILPGSANITTASGDTAVAQYLGSGNWLVREYILANGQAVIAPGAATTSSLGLVSTDGSTITNSSGAIACATATASQKGCLKPDGTSITISGGTISASVVLMTPLAVGAIIPATHSGTVNEGNTVAGNTLTSQTIGGTVNSGIDSLSGDWKALQGNGGTPGTAVLWQRID